jgi:hypothetical protein
MRYATDLIGTFQKVCVLSDEMNNDHAGIQIESFGREFDDYIGNNHRETRENSQ